jgi:hypothetical protein
VSNISLIVEMHILTNFLTQYSPENQYIGRIKIRKKLFASDFGQKMSEMFTYNMLDCITANTSGILSTFWKMRTGYLTFSEVSLVSFGYFYSEQ